MNKKDIEEFKAAQKAAEGLQPSKIEQGTTSHDAGTIQQNGKVDTAHDQSKVAPPIHQVVPDQVAILKGTKTTIVVKPSDTISDVAKLYQELVAKSQARSSTRKRSYTSNELAEEVKKMLKYLKQPKLLLSAVTKLISDNPKFKDCKVQYIRAICNDKHGLKMEKGDGNRVFITSR